MQHIILRIMSRCLFAVMAMRTTTAASATVTNQPFGHMPDGREVRLYVISSPALEVRITPYGGRIVGIVAPDREGHRQDVVLGFDSLTGYLENNPFFGASIGRYANWIAHAGFSLNGHHYELRADASGNSLHGGPEGFDKRLWDAHPIAGGVELSYVSSAGDQGYPGNLSVRIRFEVVGSELRIRYRARTDADTVLNLTNHTYFNLSGDASRSVLDEQFAIYADFYTPVDQQGIPTGRILAVAGTAFDFRKPWLLSGRIAEAPTGRNGASGYDGNWVLRTRSDRLSLAAQAYDRASGRRLRVFTDQPGMQFYTGNYLNGSIEGKHGVRYAKHAGFCMETQHFPDSPNQPAFPSTLLKAGATFHSTTVYQFSTVPTGKAKEGST